jgi:hypothetical protein
MADYPDPGLGAMGIPGEIIVELIAAHKIARDPRTTCFIASFTEEIARDSEESSKLLGKPYHYIGYVRSTLVGPSTAVRA